MPFLAEYDSTIPAPSPVRAWYDMYHAVENPAGIPYPNLPAEDQLFTLTKAQWDEHFANPSGWAISDNALVPHTRLPSAEVLKADLKGRALNLLNNSTQEVVLRCFEEALPVPADWKAYRASLREVIAGTLDTLPAPPQMPTF